MILALETATKVCSVAFCDDSGSVFEERVEQRGTHSEQLFLFIEALQEKYGFAIPDLDAVLVSEGPGSYTGLRISASAVKGLLFQAEVPLYGINTLASFATGAMESSISAETIHSVIDARRVHLYHQKFTVSEDKLRTDDDVEVIPIKALEAMVRRGDIIIGTGLDRIDKTVRGKAQTLGTGKITAKSLISIYKKDQTDFVKKVDPESFEPKYYTSSQVDS
jgi:tRNA threonylcarbamoyl adenosine modification protein YeaZ